MPVHQLKARMPTDELVHQVHFLVHNGDEFVAPMFIRDGRPSISGALLMRAQWVYDIDGRKIIKNKTGRNFIVSLGVQEVDRDWLRVKGYLPKLMEAKWTQLQTIDYCNNV